MGVKNKVISITFIINKNTKEYFNINEYCY